ncbi:hypothetical protein [Laspinema olomoucense]|uniref:Uncharacterized protein n=1 Tax=Laspinema olomoucense D3b TaxID=2953688 RepID=A0ABT2NAV7_9CYAN|nr:hypothetical protein [Laspinema sp. D3b]MCT7979841.1 hypothetical protein [Laspinema sp. D3b]
MSTVSRKTDAVAGECLKARSRFQARVCRTAGNRNIDGSLKAELKLLMVRDVIDSSALE